MRSINETETTATDKPKVTGAWQLIALPNMYVVEREDGSLAKFHALPSRFLKDTDFSVYKGHHPSLCKGREFPEYLYRFYGLEHIKK